MTETRTGSPAKGCLFALAAVVAFWVTFTAVMVWRAVRG